MRLAAKGCDRVSPIGPRLPRLHRRVVSAHIALRLGAESTFPVDIHCSLPGTSVAGRRQRADPWDGTGVGVSGPRSPGSQAQFSGPPRAESIGSATAHTDFRPSAI